MEQTGPHVNLELIGRAQQGHPESSSLLAELTEDRIFTYIYRTTLDYHTSQDLCQETLMTMARSLPDAEFQHERTFWAWLYRVAQSKMQHYFRMRGANRIRQKTQVDTPLLFQLPQREQNSGLEKLLRDERIQSVIQAIKALNPRERSILTLRCFDNLSYAEISTVTGWTQLSAKLAFFRAKKALKRQLVKQGFNATYLAAALGTFALLTDRSVTSVYATGLIKAGSLQVGAVASVVGMLMSKTALIILGILTLGWVTVPLVRHQTNVHRSEASNHKIVELVTAGDFALPDRLIQAEYPPTGVFKALPLGEASESLTVSGQDVLETLDPNDSHYLVLPEQTSIELGFEHPIVDGPGPDIYLSLRGCESMQLILTNGAGQQQHFRYNHCNTRRHPHTRLVTFDLADFPTPFASVGLRIHHTGTNTGGLQLHSLCARIKSSD